MSCGRIQLPAFTRAFCLGISFYFFCIAVSGANDISRTYDYQGFDTNGNLVVTGVATLRVGASSKIAGAWKLQVLDRERLRELGPQDGYGKIVGKLNGDSVFLNLNGGEFGDNIYLDGKITRANNVRIKGKWGRYGYYQGKIITGSFEMVAKKEPR